jgi:hypothetical protein
MATPPTFSAGAVLTAAQMNQLGCFLVKTQAVGTGVSSVTVNNAFSADYDNYLVTWSGGTGSTGQLLQFRLDGSTTGYNNVLMYGSSYATPTPTGGSTNNGNAWGFAGWSDTNFGYLDIRLFGPFLSRFTGMANSYMGSTNAGVGSGTHQVAASYTGFILFPNAGTLTGGTIRVYGFRN